MKRLILCGVGSLLMLSMSAGFGFPSDSTLQLQELIEEALQNNPELQASYNGWKATEAGVSQAASLPDPVLGFNLMNLPTNSYQFDQEPMSGKQISLMQMFPFPGKLSLKEKIAGESAKVKGLQYQELQNQLIKNLKSTYYNLFYIDKAIETSEKNTTLLKQFTQIAETRYRVGKGLQQDVLRSQVELSKITEKLIGLKQKRIALAAQLNTLLNRPPEKAIGKIDDLQEISLELDFSQLKALAEEHRPFLKAWEAMVRQGQQKVQLAKKGYLPDFNLGIGYTQRDVLKNGMGGVDYLSGMVNMTLPLYFWKKQNKKVQEEQLNEISLNKHYESVRQQVQGELEIKLNDLRKNQQLLELYKGGIIIQASQALQSSLAAYQVNKVDFLTVLNNQMMLFNYELEYYRVLSDYHKTVAELEAIVGKRLVENSLERR